MTAVLCQKKTKPVRDILTMPGVLIILLGLVSPTGYGNNRTRRTLDFYSACDLKMKLRKEDSILRIVDVSLKVCLVTDSNSDPL